eukprot:1160313-Pelagomonas_calceolata.AAC.2
MHTHTHTRASLKNACTCVRLVHDTGWHELCCPVGLCDGRGQGYVAPALQQCATLGPEDSQHPAGELWCRGQGCDLQAPPTPAHIFEALEHINAMQDVVGVECTVKGVETSVPKGAL